MPFLTPGGAMSATLDNILTSRKAEARQAMLDQLNQKNVESEIASRDENAKSSALYRKMQASQLESQEEQRKINMIDSSGAGMDSDVTGRYSPDVVGVGKQYGRFFDKMAPNPVADPSGETGDTHNIENRTFFAGTPADRKQHQQDEAFKETIPSILDAFGPDNRGPIEAILKMHQGNHTIPSASEMAPFIKGSQSQSAVVFGRDGKYHSGSANGPVIDSIPAGAHVQSMPAPPAATSTQLQPEVDPNTGKQTGRFLAFDPKAHTMVPVSGPLPIGTKGPSAGGADKPLINETTARNLAKLHTAAITSRSDKDRNGFYDSVGMVVNNSGASDEIKQILGQIISDARSGNPDPRPTQKIIDDSTKGASDDEKRYFSTLLRAITQEQ